MHTRWHASHVVMGVRAHSTTAQVLTFSSKNIHLDQEGLHRLASAVFAEVAEGALRATPMFDGLEQYHLGAISELASIFALITVEADRSIFEEGDRPESLYILLNGSVEVTKRDKTLDVLDGSIGDSGGHPYFGADALLDGATRRPWNAATRTPCNLMACPIKRFKQFLRTVPAFREKLNEFTATRIRQWELDTGTPPGELLQATLR